MGDEAAMVIEYEGACEDCTAQTGGISTSCPEPEGQGLVGMSILAIRDSVWQGLE